MTAQWKIGMFQSGGMLGTWQLPEHPGLGVLDLPFWIDQAKKLDAAGVDFLFFADDYGYPLIDGRIPDQAFRGQLQIIRFDPLALLPALAAVTERLGLVVTLSTMYERPPMVARKLASLDHFTRGRIGWNIVTGAGQNASAKLFGDPLTPHDDRYVIAAEHVDYTLRLWEGVWDDDALLVDREHNLFADPARVHQVAASGTHVRGEGHQVVPPGPQRTPMLFQAGASTPGRDLAARYAEAVFIAAEVPAMREQIADIRRRAEAYGRDPASIKCLVAGTFRVGETAAEAEALQRRIESTYTLEDAAIRYAFFTGLDLSTMDPDTPLDPSAALTETGRTNVERFLGPNAPTVREILEEFQKNSVMGSPLVGDPVRIADLAEEVIAETGADGFLVQPDHLCGYDSFLELVLPELRRRGLVGEAPRGSTLRGRLLGHDRLADDHPGTAFRHDVIPAI